MTMAKIKKSPDEKTKKDQLKRLRLKHRKTRNHRTREAEFKRLGVGCSAAL